MLSTVHEDLSVTVDVRLEQEKDVRRRLHDSPRIWSDSRHAGRQTVRLRIVLRLTSFQYSFRFGQYRNRLARSKTLGKIPDRAAPVPNSRQIGRRRCRTVRAPRPGRQRLRGERQCDREDRGAQRRCSHVKPSCAAHRTSGGLLWPLRLRRRTVQFQRHRASDAARTRSKSGYLSPSRRSSTHLSLAKDAPTPRRVQGISSESQTADKAQLPGRDENGYPPSQLERGGPAARGENLASHRDERGAPGSPTRQPRWGGVGMHRSSNAARLSPRAAESARQAGCRMEPIARKPRMGVNGAGRAALLVMGAAGVLLASVANAQEFRGTILGRVTDPQGAAIPHVTVVVTNEATNVASESLSENDGAYAVPFLIQASTRSRRRSPGSRASFAPA
ncbi:MAG: hypothetical protein DMF94_21310 [Acidobacteria bacterium]|nr:MAG: hypothetical protein DMF94_21310 [Acidobacteriota bacterium]